MANKDKIKTVSLEELKEHLKTWVPSLSKTKKLQPDDKKVLDAILDIYLWAENKANGSI